MRTVTTHAYDCERGVPAPGLQRKDVNSRDLLTLRQVGKSVKEIAEKFGIVKSTVCHRLKRDFPLEYKILRKNQSFITYYAQCARAYRLYQELKNYYHVARVIGCVHSTAICRVKFMNVVLQETIEKEESGGDEEEEDNDDEEESYYFDLLDELEVKGYG